MFDSVLAPETKKDIEVLSRLAFIQDFYLAGGTACALHLGHRISKDLDFFSQKAFEVLRVQQSLRKAGTFILDYTDAQTLVGRFLSTKISLFSYDYPILKEPIFYTGLKIAALEDIGCMKIESISARGKKRDFIDLYFILKYWGQPLKRFFSLFEIKYKREPFNLFHILKSIVYFKDAEKDAEPSLLVACSWEEVKSFFVEQVRSFQENLDI